MSNKRETSPNATVIYTDGSCIANPGPGGWAAIVMPHCASRSVCVGQQRQTTNNQMEMKAVIAGLEKAGPNQDVVVYTDSQYISNAFNQNWLKKWQKNGWRTKSGPVKNQDLWQQLLRLSAGNGRRQFTIRWVRAHSTNQLNNEVDQLAYQQALQAQNA